MSRSLSRLETQDIKTQPQFNHYLYQSLGLLKDNSLVILEILLADRYSLDNTINLLSANLLKLISKELPVSAGLIFVVDPPVTSEGNEVFNEM